MLLRVLGLAVFWFWVSASRESYWPDGGFFRDVDLIGDFLVGENSNARGFGAFLSWCYVRSEVVL